MKRSRYIVDKYIGTATINEIDYLIQVFKNEVGYSGIIFDDKKDVKEAFIISQREITTLEAEFDKINKQLEGKKF